MTQAQLKRWLEANNIEQIMRGIMPNFLDGDASSYVLTVDASLSSRTDGKHIWVSLIPECLQDGFTSWEWLIFHKALLAHECEHINSSRFVDLSDIRKWYGEYLFQQTGLSKSVGVRLAHRFLNSVEDGRIEAIAAKRRPGMIKPFAYLNQIMRQAGAITERSEDPRIELQVFLNNILSYAKTGLSLPGIQVYAGTELEKNFLQIRRNIDDGVNAATSAECREHTQALLRTCTPYLANLLKQSGLEENPEQDQEPEPEYTDNREIHHNDSAPSPLRRQPPKQQPPQNSKSNGTSSTQQDSASGNGETGEDSQESQSDSGDQRQPQEENSRASANGDETGKSGESASDGGTQQDSQDNGAESTSVFSDDGSDAGEENGEGQTDNGSAQKSPGESFADEADSDVPALTEDDIRQLRQYAEKLIANAVKASANQDEPDDNLEREAIQKICQTYGRTTDGFSETTVSLSPMILPPDLKSQADALRRVLVRTLTNKRRDYKGLRHGNLDTSALWKTGVLETDVFKKKRRQDAGECAFYLLIDNSGSMYGTCGVSQKYKEARRAAAVIEDALRDLLPCKIALFDSNGTARHRVIKPFTTKQHGNLSLASLSDSGIKPDGYNADSIHIRVAAEELKRRQETKKVLVVLSDGLPSAYGSAKQALQEVQQAVRDVKRKGIVVVSIMFGETDFFDTAHDSFVRMYGNDVIACQPSEISRRLAELFKKVLAMS